MGTADATKPLRVDATVQVADAEARRRDRARATRIGLASLAIGAAIGIAAVLLPL
jgi:hypothetical protein